MSKDQTRDQRLAEASPVIAKARALAAAGHHAAVVEFLGTRDQSELADPTLALLYGIAQTRLGRHEQGPSGSIRPSPPRVSAASMASSVTRSTRGARSPSSAGTSPKPPISARRP